MRNISFFNKTETGTWPLAIKQSNLLIPKLLKGKEVEIDGLTFQYKEIRIRKDKISIFLTEVI